MTRRRRTLSDDERSLWSEVARTAAPLRPRAAPAEPASVPRPKAPPIAPPVPAPPPAKPVLRRAAEPERLDRRTLGRLARGSIAIDARLDLHGLTEDEAHHALVTFLAGARRRGARMVLVITGRGGRSGGPERGVLNRAVPHWLASPAVRPLVSGYTEAHRTHGGSGALYVRLRKASAGGG